MQTIENSIASHFTGFGPQIIGKYEFSFSWIKQICFECGRIFINGFISTALKDLVLINKIIDIFRNFIYSP